MFLSELLIGIVSILLAVYYIGNKFYACDNNFLLNTTDAVPIFTKAKYAAECLRNGCWPTWFPSWYCGTSISQYYPPLTYIILTPLEFFLNDTTFCLKIYIFMGMFIGGTGVWTFYRRYIGSFWGIVSAILYVSLPYFAISFFYWGTIAQVPIIAVAPWYMIACIEYFKKRKAFILLMVISLTFILLLSHIMHAFLIVLSMFVTFFILNTIHKKRLTNLILWCIGTGLAVGILSFWWVTGVLPLENPGVPSLDAASAKDVTANLTWFLPSFSKEIGSIFPDMANKINAYFPISIIAISLFSYFFIKNENSTKKYVLQFLYIHTVFTTIFAFGSYLPFYRFIPLANQLVPGRILTQAAICAVILTAYVISGFFFLILKKKISLASVLSLILIFCNIFLILYTYKYYPTSSVDDFSADYELYNQLDKETNRFNKGRLAWFGDNFSSMNTYFGYISNYNIISGWNIEGTSTADYLRFQNIALKNKNAEYLLKNMNDMNVQTCLVNINNFPWLSEYFKLNGFEKSGFSDPIEILSRKNGTYFLEQTRNSIVIGKSSNVFLTNYPWFVKGYSYSPLDYPVEYYDHFNTIYFCEPELKNMMEIDEFNKLIKQLSQKGKKVFIEFGRTFFPAPLLGVSSVSFDLSNNKFRIESNDDLNGMEYYTGSDGGYVSALYGLDNVQYELHSFTSETLEYNLIGTKKIEGGNEIVFVGGPAIQAKLNTLNYYLGRNERNSSLQQRDEIILKLFNKLFQNVNMYMENNLPAFPISNVEWGQNGCMFSYESEKEKLMMVSINYSPRWKIYVNSELIKTLRIDNMLSFYLPAGSNDVHMKYGMTIYGRIGLYLTLFSLFILIIMMILYDKIVLLIENLVNHINKYMQF